MKVSHIIGIDLGTTNSLVAIATSEGPKIIPVAHQQHLLPSVVAWESGAWEVGQIKSAHRFFSFKRFMGRSLQESTQIIQEAHLPYSVEEQNGYVQLKLNEKSISAIEASALVLKSLKEIASEHLKTSVSQAVITVPAYFNDLQRQATRIAGKLAGLDVVRMVNEPTAAALAYGLQKQNTDQYIAVYDLGGGTFDISILRLHQGIFEVLATNGDTTLGGDDFDALILQAIQKRNIQSISLKEAEHIKKQLSTQEAIYLQDGSHFTQADLNMIIMPILEKTAVCCQHALKDSKLQLKDLSQVLLVGGATRSPSVQAFVEKIFQKKPNIEVHPDEAVALGAAVQAGILSGLHENILLVDVVPLSLGIENYGGIFAPLILRNSKIPVVAKETFTTFVDYQTGVDIHVLQGEHSEAGLNRSLARFQLKNIRPQKAGVPRIEVSFLVDADGILQVCAKDLDSQESIIVEVKPSVGLTNEHIEKSLLSALENADKNKQFEHLVQKSNEARLLIKTVHDSSISDKIRQDISALEIALQEKNLDQIIALSEKIRTDIFVTT